MVAILVLPLGASASVYVKGHYRSNGTYVSPHYRSNPNNSVYDNWSYKGNVNPYTGTVGTGTYGDYFSYYPWGYSVSSPKLSKREKRVLKCQQDGNTESYCKDLHMKKKKRNRR